MKKRLHRLAIGTCLIISMLVLSGCTIKRQTVAERSQTTLETVTQPSRLELDKCYIMHQVNDKGTSYTEYYPTYAGQATFNTTSPEQQNRNNRTLWFTNDFDKVPTLYTGDKLVVRTNTPFKENISFERFEYVGPTTGIAGIKKLETGRFYVDCSSEQVGKGWIPSGTDAYKLYELNTTVAVIDQVGGYPLRSGNISRGGIILGLEAGKTYSSVIYVGSRRYDYTLKADAIALTEMDYASSNNYEYIDNNLIEIKIPSSLNTGYYSCNGTGLFRLVRGTAYSDATSFNVPNDAEVEDGRVYDDGSSMDFEAELNARQTETLVIEADGHVEIHISYGELGAEVKSIYKTVGEPKARLVTDDGAYSFEQVEGANELTLEMDLKAGTYKIQIDDLYSRTYELSTTNS